MFVDKPVAGSLADAVTIYREAAAAGTPIFSSSSLRYSPGAQEIRRGDIGKSRGLRCFQPLCFRSDPPRSFLVRDPRSRISLHCHGHWMQISDAGYHQRRRRRCWDLGRWSHRHFSRHANWRKRLWRNRVRRKRKSAQSGTSADIAHSLWKSSNFFGPAHRPLRPTKHSRFMPSWKRQTKASDGAASRSS